MLKHVSNTDTRDVVIRDISFPQSEIASLKTKTTIITRRPYEDVGKFNRGDYVYAEEIDENYCFEVVDTTTENDVVVLTLKKTQYERPYKLSTIKAKYPPKVYKMLAADPCHSWRARTGIDMIHLEPDDAEQKRTCSNWRLLPDRYKRVSDQKSVDIFGCDNLSHEKTLVVDRLKKEFSRIQYGLRDPKTGKPWRDTHKSTTDSDYASTWRLAKPEETIKSGTGVCYDTVAIIREQFAKSNITFKTMFMCPTEFNFDKHTHTFVVYQDPVDKKWKWIEGSWKPFINNDWSSNNSNTLISWIGKAMANMERCQISVRELGAYPKYGVSMREFEEFCIKYRVAQTVDPDKTSK